MAKNTLKILIITIITALFHTTHTMGMVYHGTPYMMTQPNGDSVTVLLYGSDVYIDAESVDHYTLTTDEKSGEICYALLSADGNEYASSGIAYTGGEAPDALKMLVEPSIRLNKESREKQIEQTSKTLNKRAGKDSQPTLRAATVLPDTVYGLCILIEFNDVHPSVTIDQVNQFLNGDNNPLFGNAMSIKEYFQWISHGKLTYINYVPQEYYKTPENKTYYAPLDATGYTIDKLIPEIRNAINKWAQESPGNLNKLTKNIYGGIKALNILYAGKCDNKWATGLWPHQSSMQMKLDGNTFNRYVYHTYQISDIDQKLTMGTFVHENGHLVCEWPDFYQYEEHEANNASKYNIGDAFNISSQTNPTYPNPWALDQLGWLTDKQDITDAKGGKTIFLQEGVGHAAVYRGKGKNANEKYYLEVRDRHYATRGNQDKGIFIWHSNENGDNNYPNNPELLDCRAAKELNPFWVKGNGPEYFSDESTPSAKWEDGANSDIYLWDFSAYGETMSFRCGQHIETPEFTLTELAPAAIHTPYSATLTFMGGEEPYQTTLYAGQLPEGITLSETGHLEGTPTQTATETFTIQVSDAKGKKAYQEFTLSILCSTPYKDVPYSIPGSFQMESYDKGGKGISYQTKRTGDYVRDDNSTFPIFKFQNRTNGNTLGYAIIFGAADEWTQYSIDVKQKGIYEITLRNSTNYDANIGITLDYQKYDTIFIQGDPNVRVTSNSSGYKFTKKQIELPEGEHTLRFTTENLTHPLYVDSVSVSYIGSATLNNHWNNLSDKYRIAQNPTSGAFTLLGTTEEESIQVYTITNELTETLQATEYATILGGNYSKGIYLIRIISEHSSTTLKAIKME